MPTTVRIEERMEIPLSLRTLADFRRWTQSDAFPETGRIDYIAGCIEVNTSLDTGRVLLVPKSGGAADRYVELEGPPDLVVEIVSDASVRKDTERLPAAYFRAGVPEFWLIDARGENLLFQIHVASPADYTPVTRDGEGYQHSPTLGLLYRLTRSRNAKGRLTFDLHTKEPPGDQA